MPTRNPPESFTLPYKLADGCLVVIGEVCYEKPIADVLSPTFGAAFSSGLKRALNELALILPELESAITPEIEKAACRVSDQYYSLAGPRQNCALLAVKFGCAFILQAKQVFMLPSAPEDYESLAHCRAVAWPARKNVEALRDALATECKCVVRELSTVAGVSERGRKTKPVKTPPKRYQDFAEVVKEFLKKNPRLAKRKKEEKTQGNLHEAMLKCNAKVPKAPETFKAYIRHSQAERLLPRPLY